MSNETIAKEMTPYRAVGLAEGFEDGSPKEIVEAWAYLIKTGMCWSLQGWFGRNASAMIDAGYYEKDGTINWDVIPGYDENEFGDYFC